MSEHGDIEALIEMFAHRLEQADVVFGHGTDNARDEAFALVTGGIKGRSLTRAVRRELVGLLGRRIEQRVPAAYLTGVVRYRGMALRVPPGVMIPRSPIAEALQGPVHPYLAEEPSRILDLCCGCGAIGLVAATTFPAATVDLADDDPAALDAARRNVRQAGRDVARRIEVLRSDLFANLGGRVYDLVLCNPPYVPTAQLDAVPEEFHHEPRRGLDGGADGLALWRRIIAALDAHLGAQGVLVGEVGSLDAEFDATFPELGAVWLDLQCAEVQADGRFGVFVVAPALRRGRDGVMPPASR